MPPATHKPATVMVVWLSGTGCSGKTSLGKALEELNTEWRYIAQDERFIYELEEDITNRFPDQIRRIKKCIGSNGIFQALKEIDQVFVSSPEDKRDALLAISEIKANFDNDEWVADFRRTAFPKSFDYMYEEIKKAVAEGKNVLLDSWGLTCEKIRSIHPHLQVYHGLMYTPLEKCYEFLEKRNSEALTQNDLQTQRYSGTLFSSFERLYAFSSERTKETIVAFDYCELEKFLNGKEKQLTDEGFKNFLFWNEIPRWHFREIRGKLFDSVAGTDTIYLEPKKSYDFVFKESGTPSERAQKLLGQIEKLETE